MYYLPQIMVYKSLAGCLTSDYSIRGHKHTGETSYKPTYRYQPANSLEANSSGSMSVMALKPQSPAREANLVGIHRKPCPSA